MYINNLLSLNARLFNEKWHKTRRAACQATQCWFTRILKLLAKSSRTLNHRGQHFITILVMLCVHAQIIHRRDTDVILRCCQGVRVRLFILCIMMPQTRTCIIISRSSRYTRWVTFYYECVSLQLILQIIRHPSESD